MFDNSCGKYIWKQEYLNILNKHPVVSKDENLYLDREYLKYVDYIRKNADRFQKEYRFVIDNFDGSSQTKILHYAQCRVKPSKRGKYYTDNDLKIVLSKLDYMLGLENIVKQDLKLKDIDRMCI